MSSFTLVLPNSHMAYGLYGKTVTKDIAYYSKGRGFAQLTDCAT